MTDLRVVRSMPEQKPGRSKQDYGTPRAFLDACERRFGKIELDLAATDENAVAPLWITPEEDSLATRTDWDKRDVRLAFLNPPFGTILPWAKKCADARRLPILFLVPASVGSNWWARYVHGRGLDTFDESADARSAGLADLILFLRPRLSFDGKNPYPKDCALVCYNVPLADHSSRYQCWDWRTER